jgi:hypothetical protein
MLPTPVWIVLDLLILIWCILARRSSKKRGEKWWTRLWTIGAFMYIFFLSADVFSLIKSLSF